VHRKDALHHRLTEDCRGIVHVGTDLVTGEDLIEATRMASQLVQNTENFQFEFIDLSEVSELQITEQQFRKLQKRSASPQLIGRAPLSRSSRLQTLSSRLPNNGNKKWRISTGAHSSPARDRRPSGGCATSWRSPS
jgi:hypothetical protein